MTINFSSSPFLVPKLGGFGISGYNTGYALDSNFTLGTAGDCVGIRFLAPIGNVHIHSVYFFLHAANTSSHDLICHVANYGTSTLKAGTSIRSVNSAGGTTAGKWIKFDFSAYTDVLTENEFYWVVVGDAAGSGSGYSIRTRNSSNLTNDTSSSTGMSYFYGCHYNSAGFTTDGTQSAYPVSFIIVFSDGTIVGHPYTQSVDSASNTLEQGIKLVFDEKLTFSGLFSQALSSSVSTIQIYSGSTAPGGTVWSGFNSGNPYTLLSKHKTFGTLWFPSPVTFEKNTVYRLTIKKSSANTSPGYNEVEDASTPGTDALACCLGAGSWCYTIDNGAGGWTDYNNATDGYRLARMSLILKQQEVITSNAGGVYTFGG